MGQRNVSNVGLTYRTHVALRCRCSVPAAERLDIAQLAHAADECILYVRGGDALFPNDLGSLVVTVAGWYRPPLVDWKRRLISGH